MSHKLMAAARGGFNPDPLHETAVEPGDCNFFASKAACRIANRVTRRSAGPSSDAALAPLPTTGRRAPRRRTDSPAGCACNIGNSAWRSPEARFRTTTHSSALTKTDLWWASGRLAEPGPGHATVIHGVGK
jgi:hypothetical protein